MLFLFLTIDNEDDREFITGLYEQYYPIMRKKAYEITHDYSVVNDVINDAFVKLIEKISVLRQLDCCKLPSYIVHTIRNKAFDYLKHKNVENNHVYFGEDEDLAERMADTALTVEELYAQNEAFELPDQLLGLSERDRSLLYDKYILELSDEEISGIFGISAGSVRSSLSRAKARARKLLSNSTPAEASECIPTDAESTEAIKQSEPISTKE